MDHSSQLSGADLPLADIIDHLPVGVVIYRADDLDDPGSLRVLQLNAAAGQVLGIDPKAVLGLTVREYAPELVDFWTNRRILAVARTGRADDLGVIEYDQGHIRSGSYRVRAVPIPGGLVGVTVEEVSESVTLRRELARREQVFRAFAESTYEGIALVDDDELLVVNDGLAEMLGVERDALEGQPIDTLPELDPLATALERGDKLLATEIVRRSGERVPVEIRTRQIPFGAREVRSVVVRDLSYRMRALEAQRRYQRYTERILNAAGEGIVATDAKGQVTFVNEAAAQLLGPPPEHLLGRDYRDVLRVKDMGGDPAPLAEALGRERTHAVLHGAIERIDGDGQFPAECIVSPLDERQQSGLVIVFRDVSEQRAAEEQLKESENRYRTVVEALEEGLVMHAPDGAIIACNEAAERILGLSRAQMAGLHPTDPRWRAVDSDGHPLPGEFHPASVSLRTGRSVRGFVMGIITPEDEQRWILVNSLTVGAEGGGPLTAVVATFSDITEERRAQEALRASELRQRTILSTLAEGVVLIDPFGRVLLANPSARALLGAGPEDDLNLFTARRSEIFDTEGRPIPASELPERRVLATGKAQTGQVQMITDGQGRQRWISVNAQPVLDSPDGRVRAVVLSLVDITEQRKVEQELRHREAQLNTAQQIAHVGSWRWEPSSDRIEWSDELFRIFGREPGSRTPSFEEYLQQIHPDDRDAVHQAIGRALEQRKPYDVYHRVVHPSGEVRQVQGLGEVVLSPRGEVRALQGTAQDVTDQVRAREALQRYARELEERNAELEQFAYVASHDLQEPLRMVSSFLQLLERRFNDRLDDTGREYIGFAVDGAKRMQGLIQDLLAYSRVGTRGKPFQAVNVETLLREVLTDLGPAIADCEARVDIGAMPTLQADPTQMRQLFQNLVSNALKFRGDQPPVVRITAEEVRQDRERAWRFRIADNGIGIAREHAERIFQIFQRLHTRDEYEGTGIGLAICRRIVERHGGRIWVESDPGDGATFVFTLSQQAAPAPAPSS